MKSFALTALFLILVVPAANSAGVRMERMQDFDPAIHKISVNTQVEMRGVCYIDATRLNEAFEVLLTRFGFQTAGVDESQLEFAVSVKEQAASGSQPCGVMILSMARQIPSIKMLRISPGSSSRHYRLWTMETVITAAEGDLQSLLEEQARKDVVEFSRNLSRSRSQ